MEFEQQALAALRGLEHALSERAAQRAIMVSRERDLRVLEEASTGVFDALSRREELLTTTRRREEARGKAQEMTQRIVADTLAETKACVDDWAAQAEGHRVENVCLSTLASFLFCQHREWCEVARQFTERLNYRYSQRLASLDRAEERAREVANELMEGSILADDDILSTARAEGDVIRARAAALREEIAELEGIRAGLIQTMGEKAGYHALDEYLHYVPQPISASRRITAPPRPESPSLSSVHLPAPASIGSSLLDPAESVRLDAVLPNAVFRSADHAPPQIRTPPSSEEAHLDSFELVECEEPPLAETCCVQLQGGRYQAHFTAGAGTPSWWEASSAKTDSHLTHAVCSAESDSDVSTGTRACPCAAHRAERPGGPPCAPGGPPPHPLRHARPLPQRAVCPPASGTLTPLPPREWFVEDECLYVVLRYLGCVLGLDEWLDYWALLVDNDAAFRLSLPFIAYIAKQLLHALCELHTAGVSCGALAPQRVHLRDLGASLLDLHITAVLDSQGVPADPAVPDRAPEEAEIHDQVADPTERQAQLGALDGHKSDVYRLGLIVMKLVVPAVCRPSVSIPS